MILPETKKTDIAAMQIVRHKIKENILSEPALATDKDCEEFNTKCGRGCVCDVDINIY